MSSAMRSERNVQTMRGDVFHATMNPADVDEILGRFTPASEMKQEALAEAGHVQYESRSSAVDLQQLQGLIDEILED